MILLGLRVHRSIDHRHDPGVAHLDVLPGLLGRYECALDDSASGTLPAAAQRLHRRWFNQNAPAIMEALDVVRRALRVTVCGPCFEEDAALSAHLRELIFDPM